MFGSMYIHLKSAYTYLNYKRPCTSLTKITQLKSKTDSLK